MSGLIYKEFCAMKGQLRAWLFAVLILGAYGIALKSASFIYMITSLIGIMSTLTIFTYDKMYRCDEYIAAMPVSREKIVLSKYLFLLLLDIAVTAAAVVISFLFSLLMGFSESKGDMLMAMASVFGVTILLQELLLPLIYRLGAEKGRIVFMILAVSPFLLITILKQQNITLDVELMMTAAKLMPIILVAGAFLSYYISVSVYRRKDL